MLAALVVAAMAAFLIPFVAASINVALPSIGAEFQISAVTLNWIATAYLLSAAVFLVPFGRIADMYGRKRVFLWGLFAYAAASLLSALARSAVILIIFRVLHGISAAMIFGTGVAILTSIFPAEKRGKVLGINVSATYLGLSLGPVLGGMLTQYLGWRSIFYVNVPFGLATALLVIWKIPDDSHEARAEKFDLAGSLLYATALISLMYGLSRLHQVIGILLSCAGVVVMALFSLHELRTEHPVFPIRIFRRNLVFAMSNLAALINYSATFAVGFLLSFYLQYVKGFAPRRAGLVLIAQPVVMALFSPLAGRLSDRIQPRVLSSLGMGLSSVGLMLFLFLDGATSLPYFTGGLILLGLGFALFSSPNTSAVMGSVERRFYGVASATIGTMRLLGQVFSMGVSVMIFSIYLGTAKVTPANHPQLVAGIRTAFIVFSALCILGIFASLARGNLARPDTK